MIRWSLAPSPSALAPSPLWGEGGGEGQRRWMGSLLLDMPVALQTPAGRDMRPAAHLLFFASPKKRRQKKGDPTGRVPCASLRGSLRCSRLGRCCGTRCAPAALRSNNRSKSVHDAWACCAAHARPRPCASRHGQRGVQPQHGPSLRSAAGAAVFEAERSDGPSGLATPLRLRLRRRACGVARAQQDARASWSDSRGLFERRERSERSEFHRAPRKRWDAGLPRSEAQGSQTWGRFLCLLSCACKKVGRPAGASPGQRKAEASTTHRTTANTSNAPPLTPALSPEERGGNTGGMT